MINRISTTGFYRNAIDTMLQRQSAVARAQEQLATGQRVLRGADDPLAAGASVALDRSLAELERFGLNSNVLSNRLNLQESTLGEAGEAMHRLRELGVQAVNSVLSPSDRASISKEVEQIRERMLSLANSVDASGRYLFGGSQDDKKPFIDNAGAVTYLGDQVQRRIEVAPELALADAEAGSEVWLRIPTGDGRVTAAAAAGNNGTGVLSGFSLLDNATWNNADLSLRFTGPNAYEVLDGGGAVINAGAFTSGQTINFNGVSMKIDGAPAAGDTFAIGPSRPRDVFATVQNFIDALNQPANDITERTRQQNALSAVLFDVGAAQSHLIDKRASGGARLAAIDDANDLRSAQSITLKSALSDLRDVNVAEAVSRLSQESTALEAAQASFTRIQGLSLFNYIR